MPTTRRYELTDEEWRRLEPLLPGREGCPGAHAADNRRFVNAVIWIARSRAPWRDLPERFGPWNSAFQRFNRWAKRGIWQLVFEVLREPDLQSLMLDSTTVRAHQHAAGARGKKRPKAKQLGGLAAV